MKKILNVFLLLITTICMAGTPTMDGTFDGEATWGSPVGIADGTAGWASANAKKVYSTYDDNYIYLGAEITASDWMSWCFIINTKSGGGSTDSWSRDITYTHSNLPDYSIRGNFNPEAWTEINIWNGSAWTGNGTNIGATEHGDNIVGTDFNGWVEVRVPRTTITETLGDIQFFITGDNIAHGSFDACPNDDNSTGWSGVPAHSDLSNYITNVPLPVELTSFTASLKGNEVYLNWQTATEQNNYGFEIQRQPLIQNGNWEKIGFVSGNGNSNSPKNYSFADENVNAGKYLYRLKQIDTDGKFSFSKVVEVSVNKLIEKYFLEQNYPNPFNPSTSIKFGFNENTFASLRVYDQLGNEVARLFEGNAEAGKIYKVDFNAVGLSSGIYYYKLISPINNDVRKMLLIK